MIFTGLQKKWSTYLKRMPKLLGVVMVVLMALNLAWVRPMSRYRGIASSKTSALAALAITEYPEYEFEAQVQQASMFLETPTPDADKFPESKRHKQIREVVRTANLNLAVSRPAEAADRVRNIAEQFSGYVVKSEQRGEGKYESAGLQIRVPAARFEAVRNEFRKLAIRVQSEETNADDVTKNYVDLEATLRNFRAEEAQYLAILKRASTVKDVMEVTDKLSDVRREIEKSQPSSTRSRNRSLCV